MEIGYREGARFPRTVVERPEVEDPPAFVSLAFLLLLHRVQSFAERRENLERPLVSPNPLHLTSWAVS